MPTTPDGRRFYGTITVSDRGQIVIPAEARRDFNITVGEKLLVFGDPEKGLWIVQASMLLDKMPGLMAMISNDPSLPKDKPK